MDICGVYSDRSPTPLLKVGFLLSAGGAAFDAAVRLSKLPPDLCHVVVDRDCGAMKKAQRLGISTTLCNAPDKEDLSEAAHKAFRDAGCAFVVMQFSRLVSGVLYDRILTVNLHPSHLPAFPGMNAVGAAHDAKMPTQGATLHCVDEGIDTGTIIAQTVSAIPNQASLDQRRALSYRQKVILTLALIDWSCAGRIDPTRLNPTAFNFDGLVHTNMCSPGFHSRDTHAVAHGFLSSPPIF